jgi:RNA 2',3'-cyclic 3'-phosphodiesterase
VSAGAPLRAFLALDLDAAARQRALDLMARLRRGLAGVRWVRPEGLHLTLRFLGWTQQAVVDRIAQALVPAASACASAQVPLGQLGLFPERGAPRVLWVGLNLPERMHVLQGVCEEAARGEGFPPEERAFTPHLTLGRWKDRAPRPDLSTVDLGVAQIDHLTLYKSDLRPSGAIYTPLHVFSLGP